MAVHVSPAGSSVTATAALLNSYGYYHQFLPAVETTIDNLASPVEKEFKVGSSYINMYSMVCCIHAGVPEDLALE